jgi:VWFA-related protein
VQRRLRLISVLIAFIVSAVSFSSAAKVKADKAPNVPVFRSSARIVLVDVVATDSHGRPIRGLKPQDFQIYDEGKPQAIRAFDEHTSDEARTAPAENPPLLGPGVYSNWAPASASGAINVILFDTLNLDFEFQTYARNRMIEYLKTLPPGQQVALFTLGDRLRMVQGATGSSDALIAAAKSLGELSGFKASDAESQKAHLDQMGTMQTLSVGTQAPAAAILQAPPAGVHTPASILQEFMNSEMTHNNDLRMRMTLAALRDLGRALGTIPGRKNLIWVSGNFPALIGSYTEVSSFHLYDRELRMTAALLAAHQVAVYPIDARGLLPSPMSAASSSAGAAGGAGFAKALNDFSAGLSAAHSAMDEMARQTGGRAFYNSNDIPKALEQSIDSGANYYTVSYAPSNKKWDGSLRKIEVKVARQNVRLTYRRGYYAVADPFAPVLKIKTTKMDEQKRLIEAVQPGTPQTPAILMKAKVVASGADQPVEIDYAIDARNLTLLENDHGTRKVSYQLVAVAWDKQQKNAAQAWEMVDKEIGPEQASDILRRGVKSRRFLALRPGEYELYLGVIDLESKKIGTLVIPLEISETANSSAAVRSDRREQAQKAPSIANLGSVLRAEPAAEPQDDSFDGTTLGSRESQGPVLVATGVADEQTSLREPQPRESAPHEASPEAETTYTFRTAAQEVLVDAGVRDSKKRLVADLHKGDFRILEDGIEQPIAGFWYDQLPIAVALVLDSSGSMQKNIDEVQKTAAQILSGLKPQDKVALFSFGSEVRKIVDLTTDRNQVAKAIGTIKTGDSTDIVNALFVATLYLKRSAPDMRRVVILLSDNKAFPFTILRNSEVKSEADLIDTALKCETAIYSLRIRNRESGYRSSISMEKVTEQTGGEMFSSVSTGKMLDEVIQTLRKRYVLSFKPAQKAADGGFHTIELQLANKSGDQARGSIHYRRAYGTATPADSMREGLFRIDLQQR